MPKMMCKKCRGEWFEDQTARKETRYIVDPINGSYIPGQLEDDERRCPCCGSEDFAPKINAETDRRNVVESLLLAQAYFNEAHKMIECVEKALGDLENCRATLWELFDWLTTNDDWDQIVDIRNFYSFTNDDDRRTIYNAVTDRMEE